MSVCLDYVLTDTNKCVILFALGTDCDTTEGSTEGTTAVTSGKIYKIAYLTVGGRAIQ